MTVVRPFARAFLRSPPNASKGAALLVILFLVLAAFSTIVVSQLSKGNLETQKQKKTLEALAQAKQALIAWSVLQGDVGSATYDRPGVLPCPDRNALGSANSCSAAGSCSSSGNTTIGRLPWKSLGIENLQDADGELLWYAVSNNFRKTTSGTASTVNSDTKGTLLLYASDGTTLLTPNGEELAAVIFAPGPPLSGQDRAGSPDSASSYLDSASGKSNASVSGPFITGSFKDSQGNVVVNDIAIGISAKELMVAVEKRALKEAQLLLTAYHDANGKYPNLAKANGTNCASTKSSISDTNTCDSNASTCSGRFPEDISVSPLPATWFQQNAWGRVMTYALSDSGAGCSNTLTLDGTVKSYVLLAPGTARSGQTRPSANLADYLEDSANTDAWAGNFVFATPSTASNDQLRSAP